MNFSLNMDEKASIYLHEINKETLNEQIPVLKWATVPSELLGDSFFEKPSLASTGIRNNSPLKN